MNITKFTVDDVKQLLSSLSLQEQCNSFVSIVDTIFHVDVVDKYWDILSKKSLKDDFKKILEFLSPDGQFLNLILKEMPIDKSMISYPFPISKLSTHTQNLIATNTASSFIISRMQSKQHTSNNGVLFLNAFEYYMFSFFGYIYHPLVIKRIEWNGSTDSIYCQLVFRYFDMFFFNDRHCGTLMHLFLQSRNKATFNHVLPRSTNVSFNSFVTSSPINESMFGKHRFMSKETRSADVVELYFTETIVQVICEYWLNFQPESSTPRGLPHNSVSTMLPYSCSYSSVDHVCLVRVFLKNIYHFCYANCISHINPVSQLEFEFMNRLNVYRQEFLPKFIIPKLYSYLDYCFLVWPVDLSFKIVLETWLSAIQPWRYSDSAHHLGDHDNSSMIVVDEWKYFIKDNVQLYCKLLLSFAQRMSKTDLTVLRNAQMLFRVAKVIHQSNIGSVINSADVMYSHLQGESIWSEIQSQMGVVFSDIDLILSRLEEEKDACSNSWLRYIWESLSNDFFSNNNSSKRLISYLTQSRSLLMSVLNINHTLNSSRISVTRNDYRDFKHSQPEHIITVKGVQLTDFGRFQVAHGLCRLDLDQSPVDYYQRPVCSFEVGLLVAACRRLSGLICCQFQDQLNDLCLREDICGRYARFMFIRRRMPIKSTVSSDQSVEVMDQDHLQQWVLTHPPQIRIRFLASKAFLFWFTLMFLVLYLLFDTSAWTIILGSSLLYLVGAFFYVVFSGFS